VLPPVSIYQPTDTLGIKKVILLEASHHGTQTFGAFLTLEKEARRGMKGFFSARGRAIAD